jgi:hypothetical protein
MFTEIKQRQIDIQNNILKGFADELEKAVAVIGEVREWGGRKFQKIERGKWVEIKETKKGEVKKEVSEKIIKTSIVKERSKHISERDLKIQSLSQEYSKENNIQEFKIQDRVKLAKWLADATEINEIRGEYKEVIEDLSSEIDEIDFILSKEAKENREQKAGKMEISLYQNQNFEGTIYGKTLPKTAEFTKFIEPIKAEFQKALKQEEPTEISYQQARGNPSVDNYWLGTVCEDFETVVDYYDFPKEELQTKIIDENGNEKTKYVDPLAKKWKDMVDNSGFEYTHSPRSTSQYLVDRKNGVVYRYANHWGRCASCYWLPKSGSEYQIAKAKISDFKNNNNAFVGRVLNKQYVEKVLGEFKPAAKKLKRLLKKYYLTSGVVTSLRTTLQSYEYLKKDERLGKELEKIKEILNNSKTLYEELFKI